MASVTSLSKVYRLNFLMILMIAGYVYLEQEKLVINAVRHT